MPHVIKLIFFPVFLELSFLKTINNILEVIISDYFIKLLDVLLGLFLIKLTVPYVLEHP